MEITEAQIDRWLERGSKFFKTCARNPVVRGTLLARGLTDDELMLGWKLYTELHGFGVAAPARSATTETAAAQALNAVDAWDAPAYAAARAVLEARFPAVASYLFENLHAEVGAPALAGVERFLDRVAALREGRATSVNAEAGKSAVELLAIRRIVDPTREAELRALIETARRGARPEEATAPHEVDPARHAAARPTSIGCMSGAKSRAPPSPDATTRSRSASRNVGPARTVRTPRTNRPRRPHRSGHVPG